MPKISIPDNNQLRRVYSKKHPGDIFFAIGDKFICKFYKGQEEAAKVFEAAFLAQQKYGE